MWCQKKKKNKEISGYGSGVTLRGASGCLNNLLRTLFKKKLNSFVWVEKCVGHSGSSRTVEYKQDVLHSLIFFLRYTTLY